MDVPLMDRLYVFPAAPPTGANAAVSVAVVEALAVKPCKPAPLMAAAAAYADVAPCCAVAPTKFAVGPTVTVEVPSPKVTVDVAVKAAVTALVPVDCEY